MSDLFDEGPAKGGDAGAKGANAPEFSVSELSGAVKRVIEADFSHVRVRGEIGRVSRPRSGHVYLDLKDDRAVLNAIVWKGVAARLSIQPQEGDEVIATGKLTTYAGQSRYQLIVEDMVYAGEGALLARLERLKKALAAEGLFDPARKKPTPFLPEVIGVVTSPSGAVIRDILHRLADRFPRKVLIWPVAVQGAKCAPEVVAAIEGFNALVPGGAVPRPDVLIVARGGGSVEDLWGFNEESVARAVAASAIPVISAVGHETDTTLIDFVSDKRAPTPTAAAEIAVPVRAELRAALAGFEERRLRALVRLLEDRRRRLRDLARALPRPEQVLAERAQKLDMLGERLPRALADFANRKRAQAARGPAARFGPALLRGALARRADRLADRGARLAPALERIRGDAARRLAALGARLRPARIDADRRRAAQALADLSRRLDRAGRGGAQAARERLDKSARLLESYSYRGTLARGFAVVRLAGGALATRAAEVAPGAALDIELAEGRLAARAEGPAGAAPEAPRRRKPPAKKNQDPQGSLF